MKRLIICDTLYQIMIGIQMKITLFENDYADIWISDHSSGAGNITESLNNLKIFNNVEYIKTKNIVYPAGKVQKIKNLFLYGFGKKTVADIKNYDEVVFYNTSLVIYGIDSIYTERKHKTIWSRYEEGILSYETDFSYGNSVKILEKIICLSGRNILSSKIENYYCIFPQLKKSNRHWNLCEIVSFDKNKEQISNLLKEVFQFKDNNIKQKYIFFASSSDIDGRPYGETELILETSNIVGKENLIIKKHPRDDRTVFSDNGISVLDSEGVPWEVFQICSNIQDKILLTVDSGSFLGVTAMQKSLINGIFLYPCIREKRGMFVDRDNNITHILDELHKINVCKNIRVIEDINLLKTI